MHGRRRWFSSSPMRSSYKRIAIASIIVPLLLGEAGGWPLNKPPNSDCLSGASAAQRITEVRATETVVRPWLGPHNVYGLFDIPNEFLEAKGYAIIISVNGVHFYCMWVGKSLKQKKRDASAEPGRFLVREYVPTRVTLWFLINGLLDDLRRPENWVIAISDARA